MFKGKKTCEVLRAVRKRVADLNGIQYVPVECTHEGDCIGTCPACERERQYVEEHSSSIAYWTPSNLGAHLLVSYLFAFSYCPWGSPGKNNGVVCHSCLQLFGIQKCSQSPFIHIYHNLFIF